LSVNPCTRIKTWFFLTWKFLLFNLPKMHAFEACGFLTCVIFLPWKCLHACFIQGRKARLKVTRSSTVAQNRYSRSSPVSAHSPYSNSNYSTNNMNRLPNGTSNVAGEEHSNGTLESWWTSSCVMAIAACRVYVTPSTSFSGRL